MSQMVSQHQVSLTEGHLCKQLFDMHSWHTEAEKKVANILRVFCVYFG